MSLLRPNDRGMLYIVGMLGMLGLVALAAAIAVDRRSIERGNRLYRHGDAAAASALYAIHRPDQEAVVGYNLGTALLAIDDGAAEKVLASAARARDPRLGKMADYNLGVAQLSRAMRAETDDEAREAALAAMESNRVVLRQSPGHADAAWNLGVALRLIASLEAGEPAPGRRAAAARAGNPKPADRTIPVPPPNRPGDPQARAAADGEGLSTEEIERLAAAAAEDPVRTAARVMAQARDRQPARQQPPSNPR